MEQLHSFQYPPSDRRCFNPRWTARERKEISAFSIHHRIVVASTLPPAARQRREHTLSVSTIGSSLLQPLTPALTPLATIFQYPPSDRRCFNFLRHRKHPATQPFSIHHRIVVASTTLTPALTPLATIFQYPPSDRRCFNGCVCSCLPCAASFQYPPSDRRCFNSMEVCDGNDVSSLSVSTIGSSLLQLAGRRAG